MWLYIEYKGRHFLSNRNNMVLYLCVQFFFYNFATQIGNYSDKERK